MKYKIIFLTFMSLFFYSNCFAQPIKELFTQGEQAYSQGDFKKAIELYEKTIELDPNFAPAYNSLGLAHREINTDLSELAWLFKTATEIDPNFASAYDNLGKAYYGLGEFDKAEESCLKAVSLSPELLSAQMSLGWIYLLGKSHPKEAIYYFNEVIKRNKIPYAYFGLGMAYFMSGNRPMVLEVITTLRGLDKEQFAKQLENMVRTSYYAEQAKGQALVNNPPPSQVENNSSSQQEDHPSQLVSSHPDLPPEETPRRGTSMMRVRLRGKMHSASGASTTTPSSSGATSQGSSESFSGLEKIRQLRAQALGAGDSEAVRKVRDLQYMQRHGGGTSTNISY